MGVSHTLYAIIVAFIWGTNFIAVRLAYESFTPFFLLGIRFIFSIFPFIFFIPKPHTTWKHMGAIALFQWIGQFAFLFLGIYLGAPAGLASLLMQGQVVFTMVLSIILLGYKPHRGEIIGVSIATAGLIVIAIDRFSVGSWVGIAMILPAALCVGIANILFNKKRDGKEHPLSMVVWSSVIPPIPFLIAGFIFEGPEALVRTWETLSFVSGGALAYTIYFSTLVAASLWSFLLQHHNASTVVPFTLLIPLFGMGGAYIILGETYSSLTLVASFFVLLGLAINQWSRPKIPKQFIQKVS